MLDHKQQRDELNRNSANDRRRTERRCEERRGDDRRQPERRRSLGNDGNVEILDIADERRKECRRKLSRRAQDRRTTERRGTERRSDPSRVPNFPKPDGGFLTQEERDFLAAMWSQKSET